MKKIIVPFLLLFLIYSFKHPFYLSVTDLKYNNSEKALQGSVKIFTNDLEAALKKIHNKPVDLINARDKDAIKEYLKKYLNAHLSFTINNKASAYEVIGYEVEQESVFTYIELKNCPKPQQVQIENSILYDHLKDQNNIVHLEVNGERKSSKVTFPDKSITFNFR